MSILSWGNTMGVYLTSLQQAITTNNRSMIGYMAKKQQPGGFVKTVGGSVFWSYGKFFITRLGRICTDTK